MTRKTDTLKVIQSAAADAFRRYLADRDPNDIRAAAESLVAAREQFTTRDGSPDWTGRTHAYHEWVSETASAAGIPAGERTRVMAAARHHTSAALRARLSAEELDELGLLTVTARERAAVRRKRVSTLVQLADGAAPLDNADDVEEAVALVERIAARLRLARLPKASQAKLRKRLHAAVEDAG